MLFILLRSIEIWGDLDDNTELLIYTSNPFADVIKKSGILTDKIRFATNDSYIDIDAACKARLDLFTLPDAARYQNFLYLDTDIVITDSVNRVFDAIAEDLLYVLEEGTIDAPVEYWGRSLFGDELGLYSDKTAFTSGIMAFRNSPRMEELFTAINDDIQSRPGTFHDQPHIVYNAFKYKAYNNKVMKSLAVNNDTNTQSGLVIHHFPGGPGVAGHKIDRMRKFILSKLTDELNRTAANPSTADSNNGARHRQPMTLQLLSRSTSSSTVTLPAVPALLDDYVSLCDHLFRAFGVLLNDVDWARLREVLQGQLAVAYANSPRSEIVISYDISDGFAVSYQVEPRWSLIDNAYEDWISSNEPSLLVAPPDARVWALAKESEDPAGCPVLDVGAGLGRNSLPLARLGHPVDAIEMTPGCVEFLQAEVQRESLDVRVIQRDAFATTEGLRRDYQLIVFSVVAAGFHTRHQLRRMFELASYCLAPGGRLVFNSFIARQGYVPDAAAHQLGQQRLTSIFTRDELAEACAMLPLELVADDPVLEFEKGHVEPLNWPPTRWYEKWVTGQDVFAVEPEQSPIEMRWLVYRKPDWIFEPAGVIGPPSRW